MFSGDVAVAGFDQLYPGEVARSMQPVEEVPRRGQVIGLGSVGWLQVSSDLVMRRALLIGHGEALSELNGLIPRSHRGIAPAAHPVVTALQQGCAGAPHRKDLC